MIAGVFMAALLAAGVFYVIGTGDAIVFRERLQDAADAAAYTSAGVHARGMNLIVIINLIMAVLLAILVALRMVMVMLGITIIACAICIAVTLGGCAICYPIESQASQLLVKVTQAANKYEQILNKILPVLSGLEKVVAITTPYVGLAKSKGVVDKYKSNIVDGGMAVSPSMIPFLPDGKKLGLPVQEMDYDKFCGKAAEIGIEYGLFWLPSIIRSPLQKFAGFVASTFSGFFCGDSGGNTNFDATTGNDIGNIVNGLCKDSKDSCSSGKTDKDGNPPQFCTPLGNGKFEFNTALCKTETTKKMTNQTQGNQGWNSAGGSIDPKNKTPKDIWDNAKHGDVWFQVWGFTFGNEQWPRRNDKGIAIATKGGMPQPQTSWGNYRIAQAEFYWDTNKKWDDVKEDVMWEMRWRARLRRLSITGLNIGEIFGNSLFDKLKAPLGDAFGKWLNGFGTVDALFGKYVFDKAEEWAGDMFKGVFKGFDKVMDGAIPSWEMVH